MIGNGGIDFKEGIIEVKKNDRKYKRSNEQRVYIHKKAKREV